MKTLVVSLLTVAGIVLAPTAHADEAGFLDSIRALDHYAIDCPVCAQDALDVGYRACAAFDHGETAAIQEVLRSYNGPGQTNPEYYATLFAQYAAHELCPQHDGEIAPI